ncbi:polysaccharide biosynthesis protein [Bacteroidota bacterium]|nr:polysaccharide biosynthesis protein [Bacteroidota bacterium]
MGYSKKLISFIRGDQSAYHNLLKGSAISLIMRLMGQAINYGLVLSITRLFGAGGYGMYSLFQAVLQFFTQTARLGFDTLLMRNAAQSHDDDELHMLKNQYRFVLRLTAAVSMFMGIVLYACAGLIAEMYFNKPQLTFYLKVAAACILPLVHINIYASYLKGKKFFRQFNFIQQISLLLFSVLTILSGYLLYRKPELTAVAYALSCLITLGVALFWYKKYFTIPAALQAIDRKTLITASATFFIVGLMNYMRNATETLILGHYFTEDFAGIFKATQKVSSVIAFTLFSTIVAAAPHFAELYKQQKQDELKRTVQKTTALIFWSALPVFIVMIFFPDFLMSLFGKEFTRGKEGLIIMCCAQFFNAMMGPANNLLLMVNKQRFVLYITIFNNLVCALCGWFLIPLYGLNGAALINMLGILIPNIAAIMVIRREFGFFTFNFNLLTQVFKR